ncbi:hypothetical protein CEXT_79491 [Caerostris extrusa]|uniref:Uncharacterized protein n=1 Tax=Caerostris extrusa TaxID=172846 RepID=A0AAV4UQQ6_CAEEX|nr:hypothetical protein CEXT_79491 [Caerostris extrusa]
MKYFDPDLGAWQDSREDSRNPQMDLDAVSMSSASVVVEPSTEIVVKCSKSSQVNVKNPVDIKKLNLNRHTAEIHVIMEYSVLMQLEYYAYYTNIFMFIIG